MSHRLLPCGEAALLVEVGSLAEVLVLADRLRAAELPGVIDLVPAARTVLVAADSPATLLALRPRISELATLPADGRQVPQPATTTIVLPVRYDGADLDEVAHLTGLTPAEVIEAHTGTEWLAAFGGFAPGFTYLTGGDPRLRVPRRSSPRTSVPTGSVGLADEFSGVYPSASPGGWQLIGRTDAVLWDPARQPPSLIPPGARVRFEALP